MLGVVCPGFVVLCKGNTFCYVREDRLTKPESSSSTAQISCLSESLCIQELFPIAPHAIGAAMWTCVGLGRTGHQHETSFIGRCVSVPCHRTHGGRQRPSAFLHRGAWVVRALPADDTSDGGNWSSCREASAQDVVRVIRCFLEDYSSELRLHRFRGKTKPFQYATLQLCQPDARDTLPTPSCRIQTMISHSPQSFSGVRNRILATLRISK